MGLSAPARAASADLLQRYQALLKISDVILCCRNLDELFHQLAESLRNLVAFDGMAVGLLDEEGRSLKIGLLESFVPQNVGVGFSVPLDAVPGGWVINQQRPMMWTAEDETPAYKLHRDVLLDSGLKASYHLPLSTCLSRLGELVFVFKEIPHLDEVERDFMHFVANQVALAIENAGNFQDAHHAQSELERKNDQAKVLLELTNSLVSNLELRDLLRAVACGVRRVVQCACVTVLLPDADRKTLTVEALDLPQGEGILREGFVAPIEGSLAGRAFKTAAPVLGAREKTSPPRCCALLMRKDSSQAALFLLSAAVAVLVY